MRLPRRQFGIYGSKIASEQSFPTNYTQTAKYNLITFLPLNLLVQLLKAANMYFLVLSAMQMIPQITITAGQPANLLGLVPVIVISMFKDLLEDMKRHREDAVENNQRIQRVDTVTCGFTDDKWSNLRVGQLVKVNKNERFPADLILIRSADPTGLAYVETVNLDGETNLKHKQAVADMQEALDSPVDAATLQGQICCDTPNDHLYRFDGMMVVSLKNSEYSYRYRLDYDQLMLRGSSLKITQWVYGIVVYTGRETKIKQNDLKSQKARKRSRMEVAMSYQILTVVAAQMFFVVAGGLASYFYDGMLVDSAPYLGLDMEDQLLTGEWVQRFPWLTVFIKMGTWILLLTNFVPISLIVTSEVVKFCQAYFMEVDVEMVCKNTGVGAVVQQSGLNEELGQVRYIFSDKTGTLTANEMRFKCMSIGGR